MKRSANPFLMLLLEIIYLPWVFRIAWLSASNRWYVFRDAPDYVVRSFRISRHSPDSDVRTIGMDADEEWKLRQKRRGKGKA